MTEVVVGYNPILDLFRSCEGELRELNPQLMELTRKPSPPVTPEDFITAYYYKVAKRFTKLPDFALTVPKVEQMWGELLNTEPPTALRYRFTYWISLAHATRNLGEAWKELPETYFTNDLRVPEVLRAEVENFGRFESKIAEVKTFPQSLGKARDRLIIRKRDARPRIIDEAQYRVLDSARESFANCALLSGLY